MQVASYEPETDAAFLRARHSGNHHDLGLFGGAKPTPAESGRRRVGLHHLAWQVDTIDDLATARAALIRHSAYTGEVSDEATESIYGADPDGNEFEVMWIVPRQERGASDATAPGGPGPQRGTAALPWHPHRRPFAPSPGQGQPRQEPTGSHQ